MEAKLYVGNLAQTITEDDLRILFAQAGTVASVALIKDRYSGQPKGFAFVTMGSATEAQQAIEMLNAFSIHDRELTVSVAKPRENRPDAGGRGRTFGSGGSRGHGRRGQRGRRRY